MNKLTPSDYAILIVQAGLPLAQQLVALINQGNAPVTDAQWALLDTLAKYRSSDALTAAGIKIVDGVVVKL